MLTQTLKTLFARDLNKLKQELDGYKKEENIWHIDKEILNSAGNLSLHLIGNLNAYIGEGLGHTGYKRDRPAEFSLKNIPRTKLTQRITATIEMIERVLPSLTTAQLEAAYPLEVFDHEMTTEYFLVHLSMHLAYHLGQVNYHRRMIDV